MSDYITLNKQASVACTGPSNVYENTDRLYDNEYKEQKQTNKMNKLNYDEQAISRDSTHKEQVKGNKRNVEMENELEILNNKYETIIQHYYRKMLNDYSVIEKLGIQFNDIMEHHGLTYRIGGTNDSIIQSFKRFYKIRHTLMEPGKNVLATDNTFIDIEDQDDNSDTKLYMEDEYLITESATSRRKYEVKNKQVLYYLLTAKTLNLRAVRAKFNNAIKNRALVEVVSTSEICGIKLNYVRPTTDSRKFDGKVTQIGNGKVCCRKYGTGTITSKPREKTNLIKNMQNQVILKKRSLPSLTLPNTQIYQTCRYCCKFKLNMSEMDPTAINIFGNMQFGDVRYNIIEDYFKLQKFYQPVLIASERIMNDSLGLDPSYPSIYDAALVNRLVTLPLATKNKVILDYINRVRILPNYNKLQRECGSVMIYNTILSKRRDDWARHNKECPGQHKIESEEKHTRCDCGYIMKNAWQRDFHKCDDDDEKDFDLHCYSSKGEDYKYDEDWEDWMEDDEQITQVVEEVQPRNNNYIEYLLDSEKPYSNLSAIYREAYTISRGFQAQGLTTLLGDVSEAIKNVNRTSELASSVIETLPEKLAEKEQKLDSVIEKVDTLVSTAQEKIDTLDTKIETLKEDIIATTVGSVRNTISTFLKDYGQCFKPSIITNLIVYIMDLSNSEFFDGVMVFKTVNLIINMIEDVIGITIPIMNNVTQSSPISTILNIFSCIRGLDFVAKKGVELIKYLWSKFPKILSGLRMKYGMTNMEKIHIVSELSKQFALYQCLKQVGSADADKMEGTLIKGYEGCSVWLDDRIPFVNTIYGALRPIYENISIKKKAPTRVRPFFLVLEGKTRTGKSTLAHMLAKMFCQEMGVDQDNIYTRNPGSDYWDGYKGQKVVIYDDFGQSTDAKEAYEIFQVVTNNSFIPPMATINDSNIGTKGTYFTSPFVIACTNRTSLSGFSNVIVDEEALWNRVSLAFHVRRGDGDGSVDDYYLTDVSPHKGGTSLFKAGNFECDNDNGKPYKNEEAFDYIFKAMEEYFMKTKNFNTTLNEKYSRTRNTRLCELLFTSQADKDETDDEFVDAPRALSKDTRLPTVMRDAFRYEIKREFARKMGTKDSLLLLSIMNEYKKKTIKYVSEPTPISNAMKMRLLSQDDRFITVLYDLLDRYIIVDGERKVDATPEYVNQVFGLWMKNRLAFLYHNDLNSYCYPIEKLMETWDKMTPIVDWFKDLFYRINIKSLIINGISVLVGGLFAGIAAMVVVMIPIIMLKGSAARIVGQHILAGDYNSVEVIENGSMKLTKVLSKMDDKARSVLIGNITITNEMSVWEFVREKQRREIDKVNTDGTLALLQKLHDKGMIKITGDIKKIQSMAANQKLEKVKKYRIGEDENLGKLTGHPSLSPFKIDVHEDRLNMQGMQMSVNDNDFPFAESVCKSMVKFVAFSKEGDQYIPRMSIFALYMSIDREDYETTYLLPGHFVDGLTPDMEIVKMITGNGYEVVIHRSNLKFIRYTKNHDMALLVWKHQGYSNINEPRSVLKHFVSKNEIKYVPSEIDCVLVRFIKKEEKIEPVVISVKAAPISYSNIDNCYTGNNKVYQVLNGYTYDVSCKKGDCGSLLISVGSFMNNKILGFHVMGSDSLWRGGSQSVYLENFTPEYISKNCITCEAQIETFMEVDSALFSSHNQRKNNFVMTSFENEYTTKTPANLYVNEGCDPGMVGLLEHGMYQWFPRKITVPNLIPFNWKKEKLLDGMSLKIAYQGFGGMDAMNLQTSAGYPFAELHMTKKNFMEKLDDGSIVTDDRLDSYMTMYINRFREGIPPAVTWTVGLKDELLKPNKLARVFSIPPFTYTIACRYAFGEWISMMHNNPITTGVCVGMNPESTHWSQLYYMLRQQPYLLDGDYTKWDKRLHGSIIHEAVKIINSWYDGHIKDGNNQLRINLVERMYNSILVYGNKIYRVRRGMASGHVLTALMNSLCNKIVLVTAMQELLPKGHLAKHPLSKNAVFAIYGDDWLMTISEEYAKYINRKSLFAKITEIFLVGCTISTKDNTEITDFAEWDQVTFLKRRFKIENFRVQPLLEPTSIFSCLKYVRKSVFATTEEQFKTNVEVATRFLYFYGRKVYEKYAEILKEYTDIPSYRELNLLYEHEGFNIMQSGLGEEANLRICKNTKEQQEMNKKINTKKVSLRTCILKNRLLTLKNVLRDNKYLLLAIIGSFYINYIHCQPNVVPTVVSSTTRSTGRQIITSAITTFVINYATPILQDIDLRGATFNNVTQLLIDGFSTLQKDDVHMVAYSMIIAMLGLILYQIYPRKKPAFTVQAGEWAEEMNKRDLEELAKRTTEIGATHVEDHGDATIDNMMGKDFEDPQMNSLPVGKSGIVKSDSNITKSGSHAISTTTREIILDGKTINFHPLYSRPLFIKNITFGVGNIAGSLIGRVNFADIATITGGNPSANITKNQYLKLMLDNSLYANFDILLTFTVNSTKYSCGSFIVGYAPNKTATRYSYYGRDGKATLPSLSTNLSSMFARKYAIIDTTRDGIYQMVVPWTCQFRYLSKLHDTINDTQTLDYFDVALVALTPFQTPAGAPATCNISVEATLVNVELKGLAPQQVQSKLFGNDYTTVEYHLKDINNSALPMNVTGDSFTTDIKPELGLSAFGLDNPSDTRNTTRPGLFQRLWSYVNVVNTFRTRPQPNKIITFTRSDMRNLSCEVDEMSWDFIRARENYLTTYTISTTTAASSLVGALPLAPVMFNPLNYSYSALPRTIGRPARITPTTLGIFLKEFRHWRGSLEYKIYINANTLGCGKLLVAIHYGIQPIQLQNIAVAGALDGRSVTHMVIDLSNPEFEHTIKVPYSSVFETLALYQKFGSDLTYSDETSMGSLSFWLITPTGVPTGMPGNVHVVVTQKLGDDFVPLTQLDSRTLIAQTSLSQPLTTKAGKILNFVSKITSLKELLVLPVSIGYFNLDNQTLDGNANANPGLSLPVSPQYLARYSPVWNIAMTQFGGWRGSLRVRVTHLEGATVKVFWSPQRGTSYAVTQRDTGAPYIQGSSEIDGFPEGVSEVTTTNDQFIMDKNIRSLGSYASGRIMRTAGGVQLPSTYVSPTSPETIIEVADPSPMGLAHSTFTMPFALDNPWNATWNMRDDPRISYVTCKLARMATGTTTATVSVEVFAGDDFRVFWYSPHIIEHSMMGVTAEKTSADANFDRPSSLIGLTQPH